MLANPFYAQQHFCTRPSPLSVYSANVPPQFNFAMESQSELQRKPPVPQRQHKANPVMQTRDAQAKKRRDMFFKRVQNDRENKQWDARAEQIEHLDFVSEKKRWEATKAREAAQKAVDVFDEDEINEPMPSGFDESSRVEQEMSEADYMLAQEERELQELIALMEEDPETSSQHYGSDDEDYDQILMECAGAADVQQQQVPQASFSSTSIHDGDTMDTTDG